MNLKELAWAAGFFDGEGCTYATKRDNGRILGRLGMSITQGDRQVLDRFCEAVGVGTVSGPILDRGKDRWRWSAQTWRGAQIAYAKLWRFLSPVKREQVLRSVVVFRAHPNWGQR